MNLPLREFVSETRSSLDGLAAGLRSLEPDQVDRQRLEAIFVLVHAMKTKSGSLGLPRLQRLAAAAEKIINDFRNGTPVTRERLDGLLAAGERIRAILGDLSRCQREVDGFDQDIIAALT